MVTAGLWRRTRKGYAFHDWFDWGSKRSAKQQQELSVVRSANGRKGGLASGQSRSANGVNYPKQTRSKPRFASAQDGETPGHGTPGDLHEQASKPEANPKQLASQLVHGGLNPNTSTKELPPTPDADASGDAAGACEHHAKTLGRPHLSCRACGTNPRGQPPPSDAARHPSARPAREVLAANGTPASEDTVRAIAAQARQAITGGTP